MAVNAFINIETLVKNNKTILKNSFASHPFKVMNITEDKEALELHLMLMSSSPGVLDGDSYHIKIELGKASFVRLETQSYQRLFSMKTGAFQKIEIQMQEGSRFCYLPHPVVPHENASFCSKNKIHLSQGCTLLWGEVLTCGRRLTGEVFRFSHYHNGTEIFLDNQLVIKENLLIRPSTMDMLALGQLEGFTHQASFVFLHPAMVVDALKEQCREWLSAEKDIEFGISSAPVNGLIIRLLGHKGEQLHHCLQHIASRLLTTTRSSAKNKMILNKSYVE